MMSLTTVCATRSDTVGIPSFLKPPVAFGISTCLTGGGHIRARRHPVPQFVEILRQVLLVHLDRFIVDAGSPRLPFTCWYASHTVRFAIL